MTRVNSALIGLAVGILLATLFFGYSRSKREQPPGKNPFSAASSSRSQARGPTVSVAPQGVTAKASSTPPTMQSGSPGSALLTANLPYTKATIGVEYQEIFDKLNLPEESRLAITNALLSLWQLKVADVQSGAPDIGDPVSVATDEFREKVTAILGERAEEYLAWESAAAARREYAHFQDFIKNLEGVPPAYVWDSEKILKSIGNGDAYSWDPGLSVHPFESFKRPFTDTRQGMLERFQAQKNGLMDGVTVALATADSMGLDKTAANALTHYYSTRVVNIDYSIDHFTRDSKVNSLARAEAELEKLRALPPSETNQGMIAALESNKAALLRAIDAQKSR